MKDYPVTDEPRERARAAIARNNLHLDEKTTTRLEELIALANHPHATPSLWPEKAIQN